MSTLVQTTIRLILDTGRDLAPYVAILGLTSGLLTWFRAKVFGRSFEVTTFAPGAPTPVTLRAGTSDFGVFKKVFLDEEYSVPFDDSIHNVVDLGANTGLASLYFLSRFPDCHLVALEPDPRNFEVLKKNLSHWPRARCIQAAAWSTDGKLTLIDPGQGLWSMQVIESSCSSSNQHLVDSLSMASISTHLPSARIDLLKVDIEGAEKELFEDSSSWINNVNAVVIELHDRFKPGCSRSFFSAVQGLSNEVWTGENVFAWRAQPERGSPAV